MKTRRLATILLVTGIALSACVSRVSAPAPRYVPPGRPPAGEAPFGYWPYDEVKVRFESGFPSDWRAEVMRGFDYTAAAAGVALVEGDPVDLSDGDVMVYPGEVLVHVFPTGDPAIAARTHPMSLHGRIRMAGIRFAPGLPFEKLYHVAAHELGHVFGLRDTTDDPSALMHWTESGMIFRDWELIHLASRRHPR